MGVRFALDDFGSGYSALSCLSSLPLDVLKLDRTLIRDLSMNPASVRLVRGTTALAHELGFSVVAEGVEDPDQLEVLAELGCEEAQGFGIAEPMTAEVFSSWLAGFRDKPARAQAAEEETP